MKCPHITFCGKRMALGPRENGCSAVDALACDPTLERGTATAPANGDDQPYRRCTNCYRSKTKRAWNAIIGARMCECGSFSWVALP